MLTRVEAARAFELMAEGHATPAQMGGFLMALRTRGETIEEITGAVGAGVPVAKHGNRALSSRCGAADVLSALGVRIDLDPDAVARCIREAGIGFMFAPAHHPALRHVGPTRAELGTRTVFNLLGPMLNPAGVRRHVVGVFARRWVEPVARVLDALGSERAMVVHGDGLDEVTTTGSTFVSHLEGGTVHTFEVCPEDVGLPRARPEALRGGNAAANAAALKAVLEGQRGAYRDITIFNAAAALVVGGRVDDLRRGVALASDVIDDGAALHQLERLIAISHAAASDYAANEPVGTGP